MRALLLDGSPLGAATTSTAADAAAAELAARGCEVERMVLRDMRVAACTGCFGCWVRHPGECVIDDDARRIARAVANADVYMIVTPVAFGTYASLTKQVLDRCICLILPYFKTFDGEIHHEKRYESYPSYVVLGIEREHDAGSEAAFRYLVERNSINMHNPGRGVAFVAGDEDPMPAAAAALDEARIGTEVPA